MVRKEQEKVRYRKIAPRIWNDEKFRSLSDDGKLAFLFILTHPHLTMLGAMRESIPGLAAEKMWKEERFRKAFGELTGKGMVRHDEKASFIWASNFLKYNPPDNPNVVKSWKAALDLLPECSLRNQLMHHAKGFAERLGKAFAEGLPEPFRKGLAIQEQEQEQKQSTPPSPLSEVARVENDDRQILEDRFQEFIKRYPKKRGIEKARRAFFSLKPNEQLHARILSSIERAMTSDDWQKEGGRYIPYPATYITGKRWEDEYVPVGHETSTYKRHEALDIKREVKLGESSADNGNGTAAANL